MSAAKITLHPFFFIRNGNNKIQCLSSLQPPIQFHRLDISARYRGRRKRFSVKNPEIRQPAQPNPDIHVLGRLHLPMKEGDDTLKAIGQQLHAS
jgi:hypothetical protein